MLIFLKKQRDETVKLILNLQKDLNMKNKYETAMKNNSRFVDEINYVKNQTNQQKKLFILKKNAFNAIAATIECFENQQC